MRQSRPQCHKQRPARPGSSRPFWSIPLIAVADSSGANVDGGRSADLGQREERRATVTESVPGSEMTLTLGKKLCDCWVERHVRSSLKAPTNGRGRTDQEGKERS